MSQKEILSAQHFNFNAYLISNAFYIPIHLKFWKSDDIHKSQNWVDVLFLKYCVQRIDLLACGLILKYRSVLGV